MREARHNNDKLDPLMDIQGGQTCKCAQRLRIRS